MNARDIAIRTILGEALGEGPQGWSAVAHTLRNRAADPRWPSSVEQVALQPKQFSAWNSGEGGNDLVRKYGPNTDPYQKVGSIYDQVMAGTIPDPTGGATHYYAPAGMPGGQAPSWWDGVSQGASTQIGGHRFAGRAQGTPPGPGPDAIQEKPKSLGEFLRDYLGNREFNDDTDRWKMLSRMFEEQGAMEAPKLNPMQSQSISPVENPNLNQYRALFNSLGA